MTPFETASLWVAYGHIAVEAAIGLGQIAIVWYGIRAMQQMGARAPVSRTAATRRCGARATADTMRCCVRATAATKRRCATATAVTRRRCARATAVTRKP